MTQTWENKAVRAAEPRFMATCSWRGRPTNRCRWPRAAGVRVTVLTQGYEQHDAPSHVPSSCIYRLRTEIVVLHIVTAPT